MNDQSLKSPRKTCEDSGSGISSPGSADGRWPLNSPDGRWMRQCVRVVRRASLLVWLENEAGGTTPVTWLRPFSTSSQSCDLQLFLANRLAQQLKNCGSMLYSLSWKTKATPAGRQYCQRAASAPRIKEIAFSLALSTWPTSSATDWKGGYAGGRIRNGKLSVDRLDVAAQLATYPTPNTCNDRSPCPDYARAGWFREDGTKKHIRLQDIAGMASFVGCATEQGGSTEIATSGRASAWPTATTLGGAVRLASYPTPLTVPDSPASRGQLSGSYREGMAKCTPVPDFPIRITAHGQMLTGCYAGMEISGPLNPAHSRWLMGYPEEWDESAIAISGPLKRVFPAGRSDIKPTDGKECETCGTFFYRKRLKGGRMEDLTAFRKHRFCCLSCANSQTKGGNSRSAMNVQARKHLKTMCECCGSPLRLVIHHIDEDWTNNAPENLQTLCDSCHKSWHVTQRYAGVLPAGKMPVRLSLSPKMHPDGSYDCADTETPSSRKSPPSSSETLWWEL